MSDLANKYQKKTDKQHILDNPDTYIGSVENVDAVTWVCKDNKKDKQERRWGSHFCNSAPARRRG